MKVLLVGLGMLAASLGSVEGAERKPLPPVAAPEGIEACGLDGFRLPGSDGCIRLGGQVQTETAVRLAGSGKTTTLRNRAEGRLNADVRVPTDYGPLRMYGSVRGWRGD